MCSKMCDGNVTEGIMKTNCIIQTKLKASTSVLATEQVFTVSSVSPLPRLTCHKGQEELESQTYSLHIPASSYVSCLLQATCNESVLHLYPQKGW